ncbi:unnamed protein product [Didymodactylos carnosus]|uniref:Uncharacterized protein n=1 Tax=Didymodactylos carnosus TaxID=1234261 RepID=A0A815IDZ4_9BILA|nr:unnamed protein product [Didymodactylos carnosus]CAF1366855.1 unnamed protein product [Didymodactylos carnosus]CAF4034716.1 unnamed protein product [Didymodactylos carnosus]CAF4249676.1 unnamed protein product [Didymodactylos carnosus]
MRFACFRLRDVRRGGGFMSMTSRGDYCLSSSSSSNLDLRGSWFDEKSRDRFREPLGSSSFEHDENDWVFEDGPSVKIIFISLLLFDPVVFPL